LITSNKSFCLRCGMLT